MFSPIGRKNGKLRPYPITQHYREMTAVVILTARIHCLPSHVTINLFYKHIDNHHTFIYFVDI